jgi:hypothetical protein
VDVGGAVQYNQGSARLGQPGTLEQMNKTGMPQMPKSEVKFRIVLVEPPQGVDFALQLGKTAASSLVQTQRSAGGELRFEFDLQIVMAEGSEGPDFRSAGQFSSPWTRRLKVPLSGITAELVALALRDPAAVVETRVPGTGRDGGPNAATVKPFAGWSVGS